MPYPKVPTVSLKKAGDIGAFRAMSKLTKNLTKKAKKTIKKAKRKRK